MPSFKKLLKVGVRSQMQRVSDSLIFKYRGLVGIICLFPIGTAIIFSSPLITEDTFLDLAMDALGWLCFVIYATFRIWATLYVGGRKGKELQTQGPYSITRNPLYFGSFCFALSASFFLKSILLPITTVIMIAVYSRWVIAAEEQVLLKTFGDAFSTYVQSTSRLLPRLSHYHATDFVEVNLKAMKTEAKRLWRAAAFPVIIEFVMHLRTASWWPHWFNLL